MKLTEETIGKVVQCQLKSYKLTERENGVTFCSSAQAPPENVTEYAAAVVVRDAWLEYKTGHPILTGLDMTVNCGTIYSLLGSSGCGKTSLLLGILGMRRLRKGNIWVFGEKPVEMQKGNNVGYMPQDLSLYGEFTIWETLLYFGAFNGMDQGQVGLQANLLEKLLELPNLKRRICTLSGGQQRRVSLSVALLHNPSLLILDEPTVGVDPILCQKIWNYLENLATFKKTTIIITTHYIEQARKSQMVGVIRDGRIIAEMSPQNLIDTYDFEGSCSLEKAVLTLCRESSVETTFTGESQRIPAVKLARMPNSHPNSSLQQSIKRIGALTRKNFVILLRNPILLFFVVLVPSIEVFFSVFTFEPGHLKLGVVNHELNVSVCPTLTSLQGDCNFKQIGCTYLSHIPTEKVEIVTFENEQDAESATRVGNIWGYLIIAPEFSSNLFDRLVSGVEVDEKTLNSSQIIAKMDETNVPVSIVIKVALFEALQKALSSILSSCGLDPIRGQSPLQYGHPVNSKEDGDLRKYTSPGMALAAMYFFPIITIGIRFVNERKCGMFNRSLVAGVHMWEIVVAYLFSEFFLILVQSLLVLGVVRLTSNTQVSGSIPLCLCLLILAGYCGISLGFLLGSIFNEEIQVALVGLASFIPNLALCGIVWPVLGMPQILQQVANVLPCALSAESIRSIVLRGWGISHENVWPGFLVLVLHMFAYSIAGVLFHKYKSR